MCMEKQRRAVLRNTGKAVSLKALFSPKPLALEPFPYINVDSPQKPSWHRASTTHPFLSRSNGFVKLLGISLSRSIVGLLGVPGAEKRSSRPLDKLTR